MFNFISIHALLAESDKRFHAADISTRRISIHALLAESDLWWGVRKAVGSLFLSTLSLRRATRDGRHPRRNHRYFYPRSPCGERPTMSDQGASNQPISIHALLAESDKPDIPGKRRNKPFLSTLSLRRATERPAILKDKK